VIRALGVDDELARGSIRFSFGKDNTEAEVDYVVEVLAQAVERLRALSPLNKPPINADDTDQEKQLSPVS
jgi:cysteine desulfurase